MLSKFRDSSLMTNWFAHQHYLPHAHPMVIAIAYTAYCCSHAANSTYGYVHVESETNAG